MIAKKLCGIITYYSVLLDKIDKREQVIVGGQITEILNLTDIGGPVYLSLDDGVGTVCVVLLEEVYKKYTKTIKKDAIVIVEGLAESFYKHGKTKEMRVYGFKINTLPSSKKAKKV